MSRPLAVLFAVVLTVPAVADEKLKGIACRSVHLAYQAEPGTAFYVETTVRHSADGSYFCAAAFNSGYFGIQELASGKKLAIFSVWDPTAGDDPKSVPEEKRVQTLHRDEAVSVGRFGGEGTGGQSFFDFDWKTGEPYRFLVTAEPHGKDRTAFSGHLYLPEKKAWKHLVMFSTLTTKKTLSGYYSFVEDFRRNKTSTTKVRSAEFGNAWVKLARSGEWQPVTAARFTADSNPVTNIDAGVAPVGDRFFLSTGGDTANATTKLRDVLHLPGEAKRRLPEDLPIAARNGGEGRVVLPVWKTPVFSR
jgi:hypothetical protein